MQNRKELVHELFELRFELELLNKHNDLKKHNIEERIMAVRKKIINIDMEEAKKKRGRSK